MAQVRDRINILRRVEKVTEERFSDEEERDSALRFI